MKGKRFLSVALVVAGMAILSVPAMAFEGQRTSYISNAQTGFQSQRWYDGHIDNWSTDITFENCTDVYRPYLNVNATIELRRDRSFQPDVGYGSETLHCYNAFYTGQWGEMPDVGNYFFELTHINGSASGYWLDVQNVYFSW